MRRGVTQRDGFAKPALAIGMMTALRAQFCTVAHVHAGKANAKCRHGAADRSGHRNETGASAVSERR